MIYSVTFWRKNWIFWSIAPKRFMYDGYTFHVSYEFPSVIKCKMMKTQFEKIQRNSGQQNKIKCNMLKCVHGFLKTL